MQSIIRGARHMLLFLSRLPVKAEALASKSMSSPNLSSYVVCSLNLHNASSPPLLLTGGQLWAAVLVCSLGCRRSSLAAVYHTVTLTKAGPSWTLAKVGKTTSALNGFC